MKKILILLVCLLPVITFTSCDDKDDIRKDIDDLNARLDALTDDLENLNTSIKSFQDAVKGLVLVTGYTMDEKGNYTLSLVTVRNWLFMADSLREIFLHLALMKPEIGHIPLTVEPLN